MKKEAYYFSHDANARHDPNICEMRAEFGMEGYGLYWAIIEMLREQENYKLSIKRVNAIAMQTYCEKSLIKKFITQCIEEYGLFESDEEWFWSKSLLRRMKAREEKSKKARKSAEARWGKNTNAIRTQSNRNALKEKKRKESKKSPEKKHSIKIKKKKPQRKKYGEYQHVLLTPSQYKNLLKKWGQKKLDFMIKRLDEGIEMKGYSYKNHNLAIQNWEKRQTDIPNSEPTEYDIEDE